MAWHRIIYYMIIVCFLCLIMSGTMFNDTWAAQFMFCTQNSFQLCLKLEVEMSFSNYSRFMNCLFDLNRLNEYKWMMVTSCWKLRLLSSIIMNSSVFCCLNYTNKIKYNMMWGNNQTILLDPNANLARLQVQFILTLATMLHEIQVFC